jgi:hypothetical protein
MLTCFFTRPIGGGSCGNLRDATIVVSSMGMCASYAWSNQKTGFCIVDGQCFTSESTDPNSLDDGFQAAFDAAVQVPCNTPGAMTCYTFASQSQARRSKNRLAAVKQVTGTARRQALTTVVGFLSFPGVHCILMHISRGHGLSVGTSVVRFTFLYIFVIERC